MNNIEIITENAKETQKAGEILAQEIKKGQKALIIGLEGELGSGKTTFVQGLAKGLKIKEKITSPTFVIMKKIGWFYHIDCYRLNSAQELLDLGFKEIINHSENLIVIEWAERVRKILSRNTLWIKFEHLPCTKQKRESGLVRDLDKNKRKMTII